MKKLIIKPYLLLIISLALPSFLFTKHTKSTGLVKEIHNQREINENLPAIIEFYKEGCGACKMFQKKFEALAEKYPNINFLKINGEKHPNLLSLYDQAITSYPSFALVINSKTKNPQIIIGPMRHEIELGIKPLLKEIEKNKHPHLIEVESFQEFQDLANKSNKIVVATYHASWCGHCKTLAPKLLELSDQYGNSAIFIKLNEAEAGNKAFATKYLGKEFGFPTTCIFKAGELEKPITTIAGANIPALNNAILQATKPVSAATNKTTDTILHIENKAQLEDLIKNSSVPVVIDFHNEKGCVPCRMYKDIFANYASNNPKLKFAKVDVTLRFDDAHKIVSIPTTLVFENGKETHRFTGIDPKIEATLQTLSKK